MNTDWFCAAKWGVFMHYLADSASNAKPISLTPEEWNHQVECFDVAGLARQLADVGVGYFFITLGQNSGFYISPNATYDRLVGRVPSRLSRRDLIADLADALAPYGIRLMVYFGSSAPALDAQAIEALKCTPSWDPRKIGFHPGTYRMQDGVDERLSAFQVHWEAVIREWSLRWGKAVHGWWIDGSYAADKMYRHPDPPNFQSFAAALKAGNAESLVAFNPGVQVPVIRHSEYEDYTAGEVDFAFPVDIAAPWNQQPSPRFCNGAQYHILSFLGGWWGQGPVRFPDAFVIEFTRFITQYEGVITWDVAPTKTGLIEQPFMEQLIALRNATR